MNDPDPFALLAAAAVFAVPVLAQVALVPMIAARKGRDGALWFFVALVWLLLMGCTGAFVAPMLAAGAVSTIIEQPGNPAAWIAAAVMLTALPIVCLPLIVVWMLGSRESSPRSRRSSRTVRRFR